MIAAVEKIREIDTRLLVSGERLRKYRAAGQEVSANTQRSVINRQLDERLEHMRTRDRAVAS